MRTWASHWTVLNFVILILGSGHFASAKTIVCGGDQPGTIGAKISISFSEMPNGRFYVDFDRSTNGGKFSSARPLVTGLTSCQFSTIDERIVTCSGGPRRSPKYFQISLIQETHAESSAVASRFQITAVSDEIEPINQKELDISGVFNSSTDVHSSFMELNFSQPYTCTFQNEQEK